MTQPIIGIDFDNTIVCYDEVFHTVALERKLIPQDVPKSKDSVRNYLRKVGQETVWTELQGYVYGTRMREATAYPGVLEFMRAAVQAGCKVYVISHKTLYPYLGPEYDLHKAARDWMDWQGLFDPNGIGLTPKSVYLELSIDEKIDRISRVHCTHFIDDLPELFHKVDFPTKVEKILFNPHNDIAQKHDPAPNYQVFNNWQDIHNNLLSQVSAQSA